MKICIVGAGAVGGMLAVRLCQAGHYVIAFDQGINFTAIQSNGLRLNCADGDQLVASDIVATDDLSRVGAVDLVVLAVKAHQISVVAPLIPSLYGPETVVLTIQNGIPWWYFQRHGGPMEGTTLRSLDEEGGISAYIPPERILGSVVYPACKVTSPGVIKHVEGHRIPVGELNGRVSDRATEVADVLTGAGFKSFVLKDIRSEIWLKAWGALAFNPISALTRATMVDICQHADTHKLLKDMMLEAQQIAHKLGINFRVPLEKRIAGAEAVGAHKTSMLQDLESGRSMEIDAVIGSVVELARITDTLVPAISAVYACVKLLDNNFQQPG